MESYYRDRAATYERIYAKPERQADLRVMEAALPPFFAGRRVLEIACGTGWWTLHGAQQATRWLATDLNPETMAVAQRKPMPACVHFCAADAYTLAEVGEKVFDAAFAGFWWSHVPRARLAAWLQTLHTRLAPGAVVMLLDNLWVPGSSTPISHTDAHGDSWQQRPLDDGSVHAVRKNFPTRDEALALLGPRARNALWTARTHYWVLQYTLA